MDRIEVTIKRVRNGTTQWWSGTGWVTSAAPTDSLKLHANVGAGDGKTGYWLCDATTIGAGLRMPADASLYDTTVAAERSVTIEARLFAKMDGQSTAAARLYKTVDANSQSIAKLQYSLDEGVTWADVPQPGQSGFPLTVDQDTYVDFRAVKSKPTLAWPVGKPVWSGDGYGDGFIESNIGGETWAYFDQYSLFANDTFSISAECGNTVSAEVHVRPRWVVYVWSDFESILAGGFPIDLSTTKVYAQVVDEDGYPVFGAKASFAAKYSDGTNAGQINGVGITDDAGTTDTDGIAEVLLKSGGKLGQVLLTASTVDGTVVVKSGDGGTRLLSFEPPIATVRFGSWQLGTNNQQSQQCTVTVTYDNGVVPSRAIKLRIKVTDSAGNLVSSDYQNAAQLAQTSASTNTVGVFTTTLKWTPPASDSSATPQNYKIIVYVDDTTLTQ